MLKSMNMTFNDKDDLVKVLGDGRTSDVYLGEELACRHRKIIIKIYKDSFIQNRLDARKHIENEVSILRKIDH